MKIFLVTGNIEKWKIAETIFKEEGLILERIDMETPEIQSLSVEEVSKFSAEYASSKVNELVIKSDVGYYIEELNGFPGPYVKHINKMLTSKDILKLMADKTNRKIILKECVSISSPSIITKQFINIDEATISEKEYGEGTTFDKIVILSNSDKPKSLNSIEENRSYFIENLKIYSKVAKYIKRNLEKK